MSRADTLEPRFEVVAETGSWPNGIAINRDGSLWVADYRGCCASIRYRGVADQHAVTEKLGHRNSESFKGLNDLTFDADGNCFVTRRTGCRCRAATFVAHSSLGCAFVLDAHGAVTEVTAAPQLETIINVAFRPDSNELVLTDSETGSVLVATLQAKRRNCSRSGRSVGCSVVRCRACFDQIRAHPGPPHRNENMSRPISVSAPRVIAQRGSAKRVSVKRVSETRETATLVTATRVFATHASATRASATHASATRASATRVTAAEVLSPASPANAFSAGTMRRRAFAAVAFVAVAATTAGITPVSRAQPNQRPPAVASKPAVDLPVDIRTQIGTMYPDLEALYRDLHAHPELGFKETRTAGRLAAEMKALGFEVTEGVAKTGVVAILRNGSGPTVMVRTELDALPMEEKTGLPFASRVKTQYLGRESFVAHSCGHDIHMTSWVGTARALATNKAAWQGTLMFVAQPAEEMLNGAQAMLDDGLFTRFPKPDFAFALHTSPSPYGTVGYNFGAMTSNSDGLDITFKGRGGHGSAPHLAIDPIAIAARFIVDVQTIVSREKDPMEFGVITVGAINAGTAGNIIPESAVLRGTIRSYRSDVRDRLLAGVRRTAQAAALVAGAPEPEVTVTEGGSAIVNSDKLVSRTEAS